MTSTQTLAFRTLALRALCVSVWLIGCVPLAHAAAAPTDITIDDTAVFPESLSSTPDGTLYIGSMGKGLIYRVHPGAGKAEPWISHATLGAERVLGVLAEPATDTLWVCADGSDASAAALKTFSLKSGALKQSYSFPGGGFCNDIALKGGAAYVTDTRSGRILVLAHGASDLKLWYQNDPADPSLDGLTFAPDGNLYTNTYSTNHLIRVAVKPDGSAGAGTVLSTSIPIYQPDGLRLTADGRILLVEGQQQSGSGRLDEVTVSGNAATIKILKDGYMLPTAVTAVGQTAWVLEAKLNYQRDPALKGKDPGLFHVYAVPLKP
jgi:sugar lactone lactonase YvrE